MQTFTRLQKYISRAVSVYLQRTWHGYRGKMSKFLDESGLNVFGLSTTVYIVIYWLSLTFGLL